MKTTYKKSQPKIIIYRSYKYFNNQSFREKLLQIKANGNNCNESFKNFTSLRNVILNKHTPRKKYVRGNQSPFMNKTFSKTIMQRSKLRKNFSLKRGLRKIEIIMLSKGIYVLNFCEKVKASFLGV